MTKKKLLDYQREDVDQIKQHKLRVLVASAPGTGKAQPETALVLTPSGWVTIGSLVVGDIVNDPDGGTATVMGIFPQGKKEIYEVTFTDKTKVHCCKEHLWLVRDRGNRNDSNGGWKTVDLNFMINKGLKADGGSHRWSIPLPKAVEYVSEHQLKINSYVLGALLGDGGLYAMDKISFTTEDKAILDRLRYELGPELTIVNRGKSKIDYIILSTHNFENKKRDLNPLTAELRELGLMGKKSQDKFIPKDYLKSSVENRIELLRGLMDTDGTVSRGLASYCTTSKQLAEDVMDIVRGLGGSCTLTSRIPTYTYKGEKLNGLLAYNVMIRTEFNPFYLERKAKAWAGNFRAVKSIESIQSIGEKEAVCISVNSKRNIYITDDYTVTHNTAIAIRSLAETYKLSFPALILCPASVVENWALEFQEWAPGIKIVIIDDMASRIPTFPSLHVVYVMSWAMLDERELELGTLGLNSVVADECHYIKNPEAQRTKAFGSLASKLKHVMLLSGTPIVNSPNELSTIKSFIGDEPLMIRRLLEDVATFVPPKARSYLPIELRPKHRAVYDKAVNEFEQWLREEKERLLGEGNAEHEVERILAVEGFAKIGYLRRLVAEYKVPAALDWIARAVRLGEPVVVFMEHQVTLTKIQAGLKRLHIRYTTIEGSTTNVQRQEAIEAFQRGDFPVFLGSKAAKEGITLTTARNLLFVERFFTSADEEQAEDRIRRISQKHKTTIWFLHAIDTIDDRLDQIVRRKRQLVRTAIGSADIMETVEANVQQLLRTWNEVVDPPGKPTGLGLGDPLPSLPKAHFCYAVMFEGPRWKEDTARQWCKMNGYPCRVVKYMKNKIQVELHPHAVFKKGEFDVFRVSKEIKIITGKRTTGQNARKIRSMLTKQYDHDPKE